MKLEKFLKMIDPWTSLNTKIIIKRNDLTPHLVEAKLLYVVADAIPYLDSKVVEFGYHNDALHIVIK